jgi:MFS transporter, DHA1 family, inner membrane transport protein
MSAWLASAILSSWTRFERQMAGSLQHAVRINMRIELAASVMFGLHYAVIQFIPVVLRRQGASPELLALFGSQSYLSLILAGFVAFGLGRRHPMRFVTACWLIGRSAFLWMAFVSQLGWFLTVTVVYQLMESFPGPIYARIVQTVYPAENRGQVMSLIKQGMALTLLLMTPLAGYLLDRYGYQVLFPAAGLAGIASALFFTRLRVDTHNLLPAKRPALRFAWRIAAQDRRFATYLSGVVFFGLGGLIGTALYPLVQVDRLGLSYTELGWLGLIQSLCWLLSYFYWGRAVDRRGGVRSLQLCALFNAVVPLGYIWSTSGWMLVPSFIAIGLTNAGTDIGFINAGIQLADPARVPEYSATQAMVIGLRGIAGLYLGVALHNFGVPLEIIFTLAVAFNLIAVWIFGRVAHDQTGDRTRAV